MRYRFADRIDDVVALRGADSRSHADGARVHRCRANTPAPRPFAVRPGDLRASAVHSRVFAMPAHAPLSKDRGEARVRQAIGVEPSGVAALEA